MRTIWTRERLDDVERYERAARLIVEGVIPWFTSVVRVFGTWNDGIRAAGYEPREPHGGAGNQYRRQSMRGALSGAAR
jgi:hypothetical protein